MVDDLQALQQRFQDYLEGKSEDFEQDIVSTPNARAEHRLGAYYNAYRLRLIECLATDFAGLCKEIGEEAFEYLVLDYLKLYPSQQPSIRWVGQHMTEFLNHSEHDEREFLTELAEFEWTQGLCFDAPADQSSFTLNDMASIAPEQWPMMRFQFQPSMRWLDLHWNVPQIKHAVDNASEPPGEQRAEYPLRWLLWRKELKTLWRSLEVDEAWALEQAAGGADFAAICEGLLEWIDAEQVSLRAAGLLKQWIGDELLIRVGKH